MALLPVDSERVGGKYGLAIDAYKKAMALDPDDITAYRIMNCYEELGNWKAALEYVDKAIEMDPEDINYKNAKANLYWFSDNLDSAIVEITKCVEAEPENYFYYHRRGWFKEHNNDEEGIGGLQQFDYPEPVARIFIYDSRKAVPQPWRKGGRG